MPFLVLVFGLFIAGYVGRSVFRHLHSRGRGKFFSELIGAIVGGCIFFVCLGIMGMTIPKEERASSSKDVIVNSQDISSEAKPSNVATAALPSRDQEKTQDLSTPPLLDYDSKIFQKKFNQAAKAFKSNLRLNQLKFEKGPINDSFTGSINENIVFVGSIDKKTQKLQSVTMIAQGDGTMKSGANIMLGIGQLIMTIAPELDAKGRGQLLKDMGLTPENLEDGAEGRYTIGNKKFFFTMSDMIGLWFGVEAIDPNAKP